MTYVIPGLDPGIFFTNLVDKLHICYYYKIVISTKTCVLVRGFRGGAPRRRGSEQRSANEGKAFPSWNLKPGTWDLNSLEETLILYYYINSDAESFSMLHRVN